MTYYALPITALPKAKTIYDTASHHTVRAYTTWRNARTTPTHAAVMRGGIISYSVCVMFGAAAFAVTHPILEQGHFSDKRLGMLLQTLTGAGAGIGALVVMTYCAACCIRMRQRTDAAPQKAKHLSAFVTAAYIAVSTLPAFMPTLKNVLIEMRDPSRPATLSPAADWTKLKIN